MPPTGQHEPAVRNRLLAALPPGDLARLRPGLQAVELPFDRTVQEAGGAVGAALFPEGGMVSLVATLDGGERAEVGIVGSEGMVGLPLAFGDDRSPVEARVQLGGAALRMDAAAFRAEMDGCPAFRGLLLRYASALYTQVTLTAACNARHAVERRLARWLLMAHDRAAGDDFPMTHELLSLMLGVRRAGVTAAAGVLREAGLIRYARGRVSVADRAGLEAAGCECYRTARREFSRLLGAGAAPPPG